MKNGSRPTLRVLSLALCPQHKEVKVMNALFKDMVDCHMSIYKFVTQYEKIFESRYDREDEEIFRLIQTRLSPWSCHPIETQAIDIYTRNLFKIFLEQLKLTIFLTWMK